MTDMKSSKDENSISYGQACVLISTLEGRHGHVSFLGNLKEKAEVAELVDALDSGSSGE